MPWFCDCQKRTQQTADVVASCSVSLSAHNFNRQKKKIQSQSNNMMQQRTKTTIAALAVLTCSQVDAFASFGAQRSPLAFARTHGLSAVAAPTDMTQTVIPTPVMEPLHEQVSGESKKAAPKKKKAPKKNESNGIFTPIVLGLKATLGVESLNKLRAKAISTHSDVIGNFVKTSESELGQAVLRELFNAADANHNGRIEKEELNVALKTLGFSHLKAKQVDGIFKRADADEDGSIDVEEWLKAAPNTLRTNLIKLAKKNGHDLGFLA